MTNLTDLGNDVDTHSYPQDSINNDVEQIQTHQIELTDKFILRSLRQSSYDTETSLSENVDNSADADSLNILIGLPNKEELRSGKKPITIIDDGNGMTLEVLIKAFNFGSERSYNSTDIGTYGIGMKGSFAYLGQYVEVITKTKDSNLVSIARWDIENNPRFPKYSQSENIDPTFIKGTKIYIYPKWGDSKDSRMDYFSHTQAAYIIKRFASRYFNLMIKDKIKPNGESLPKLKIFVNEKEIIPHDPMYRNDLKVKNMTETVNIKVNGEEYSLDINGYYLGYVEPSGFDGNSFSFENQGVWALTSDKYLSLGGTWMGCRQSQHGMNETRIEFDIPKELTDYMGVSMNKNSVIDLQLSCEENSLSVHSEKQKIIDAIKKIAAWGWNLAESKRAEKKKNNTEDQNKQAEKLTKDLNKKLKNSGLLKPSDGVEKLPEMSNNTPSNPTGLTKNRPSGLNYDKELFRIDFYQDNKNGSFWNLTREGKKTIMSFNTNHSLYEKYITTDNNDKIIELFCAMALAEQETYKLNDLKLQEWEEYWYDVSKLVNRFSREEDRQSTL